MLHPVIRRLAAADVELYRALRLEAVKEHPDAFGGSYADESQRSTEDWLERLKRVFLLGTFIGDDLVAMIGVAPERGEKRQHIASIVSVYCKPAQRGNGYVQRMLVEAISSLKTQHEIFLLSVNAKNEPAKKLYERAGFKTYGIEPKALKVAGQYHDEVLMYLEP